MSRDNFFQFLNGKFIFQNSPTKRWLFHLFVSAPIIIFGGLFLLTGEFPPPANVTINNYDVNPFILNAIRLLALLWIYWFIRAFVKSIVVTSSATSKEEKYKSYHLVYGKCPHCFSKIPRSASKCPKCTADLYL